MNEIVARNYQLESTEKTIIDLQKGLDPVVGLPTGSGKSIVLCSISERIIDLDFNNNILILSHVKEILSQNKKALENYFFGLEIGLYSSGLKSKTIKKMTVASIQTVQNCPEKFKHFTHVIIDEAHRIGFDKLNGYRKFLNEIKARCIGLTATPYRMKGGYIYQGDDALFNSISIDMTTGDNFTSLIDDGYLSEIYSKKTALTLSDKGIKKIGGDFSQKDLSNKFDREHITEAAVLESCHFGKKYNCWLAFAIDIDHANNICESLIRHGISAIAIHSKMENRDQAISDFKNGKYKACVNVDILTTGFDHPAIDFIIMLRHTNSPIIHVQTTGRGLRVLYDKTRDYDLTKKGQRLLAIENSTKNHCLVLDFAGNTKRLGPINDVKVRKKGERGSGEAMAKCCPECEMENHLSAKFCCNCDFEFVTKEKISKTSSDQEMVSRKSKRNEKLPAEWAEVQSVQYNSYQKNGRDMAIIVRYHCGIATFKEYVFIEGNGFGKHKANGWIKFRWNSNLPIPNTVSACINFSHKIDQPKKILVDNSGKYTKILDSKF